MKKFILAALLLGSSLAVFADEVMDEMTFTNPKGNVVFHHKLHQEKTGNDCAICHPPFEQKFDDEVSIKDLGHKTCKDCHKAQGGPTKCNECHQPQ